MVVDAIAKRVEETPEAATTRFPRALRGDYPDIDWDAIAGIRNRLAHDYENLDVVVLADVVENYLPRLIGAVNEALGASGT